MAEQLLLCGDIFEDELLRLSFERVRMDIGIALIGNSCK